MAQEADEVLLVGSIPLRDSDQVFCTVAQELGGKTTRIPDGETGPLRSLWIQAQRSVFIFNPYLQADPEPAVSWAYGKEAPAPRARIRPAVEPTDIAFTDLLYANWAKESYARFRKLRDEGVIAKGTRFQVCLPTPLACMGFVFPEDQRSVEPAYEAGMLQEVNRICEGIPHDDLAIQWDVCIELNVWDGWRPTYIAQNLAEIQEGITDRLIRIGEHVPSGVELGYHLCYGDLGGRHFREPEDAGMMVDIANRLLSGVGREVTWLHIPVPVDRNDAEFFAPLNKLQLRNRTRLYLGIVHDADGLEGARKRFAAARSIVSDFGIATECGMGRRQPETIVGLLRLHREIAAGL